MKKQSRRAQERSSPSPVRHQLDHVVPTVIHDPEEKMTALGRFTRHALNEPRRYLGWPAAIVAGLLLAVVIWKLTTSGRSPDWDVWMKLETTKTAEDRVNLAKEHPGSPVANWARLQAATEYFNLALSDLPLNRDVALPTAKKALELFEQVERDAPHDSPQARTAAFGKARALEMRNELSKALEQYRLVAKEWPGSTEATEAKQSVQALEDPRAAAFYKEFYAFTPTTVTLPPMGTETFPSSLLGPLGPESSADRVPDPFGPLKPEASSNSTPPPAGGTGRSSKSPPPRLGEVRVEPRTETPNAAPGGPKNPAPQHDLPADVFSSSPKKH